LEAGLTSMLFSSGKFFEPAFAARNLQRSNDKAPVKRGGEPDRLSFLYADHLPLVDVLHHREASRITPSAQIHFSSSRLPCTSSMQEPPCMQSNAGRHYEDSRMLTAQLTGGATHYINSTLVAAGLVLDIRAGIIAAII